MQPHPFDYQPNFLPNKDNENIRKVISLLDIDTEPFYLDIIPDDDAEFGACFINVLNKVAKENGEIVYGWQFAEYSYMIEAQFHAIWKSPNGKFVDITKRVGTDEKKNLFVIDAKRKFDGTKTDNVRLNTTDNELVDDMIELEKARFRFLNKTENELYFNAEETVIWNDIDITVDLLEEMYFSDYTVQTNCRCNSGKTYNDCHRINFKQFISSI